MLFAASYTVDAAGLRTAIAESDAAGNSRTVAYEYDGLKRLTNETIVDRDTTKNRAQTWTYDQVGNRLTQIAIVGGAEAPITTTTTYTYDANDRLTGESAIVGGAGAPIATVYTYDANGNTTGKASPGVLIEYDYDDANRLKEMRQGGAHTTYAYDADGLRIRQTTFPVTGSPITTQYLQDGSHAYSQVIEEYTQVGGATPTLAAVMSFGDEILSQTRYVGTTPTTQFVHADGMGSTRLLTDSAAAVTDRIDFDAFGNTLNRTGSTDVEHLYRGEQLDLNLGFYYLRARYIDPSSGRFATIDPLAGVSRDPPSLHRYLYANANPIEYSDPSGLESLPGLISAMNSFISLQLRAISLATSNSVRGFVYQRLGRGVEQYVARLVASIAERAGAQVARNYGIRMFGKQALIDFMITLENRVVYLEVKYGIPKTLGPAMSRLVKQLELSLIEAAVGEGGAEVIVFAASERAAAEAALRSLLGESAAGVETANGLIELANVLRQIFIF